MSVPTVSIRNQQEHDKNFGIEERINEGIPHTSTVFVSLQASESERTRDGRIEHCKLYAWMALGIRNSARTYYCS